MNVVAVRVRQAALILLDQTVERAAVAVMEEVVAAQAVKLLLVPLVTGAAVAALIVMEHREEVF